jgi:hypothetical protein
MPVDKRCMLRLDCMLGCVLVVSEVALLPEITESRQLILMLPACEASGAQTIL